MKISNVILGFLFGTLMAFTAQAGQKDCPVPMGDEYLPKVLDEIRAQTSCYGAADTAVICGLGSAIDLEIAGQARYQCELRFADHLKPEEMTQYKALLQKCLDKYMNQQGTIYLSAQAFCELNQAQAYDSAYTPFETDDNGKPLAKKKAKK